MRKHDTRTCHGKKTFDKNARFIVELDFRPSEPVTALRGGANLPQGGGAAHPATLRARITALQLLQHPNPRRAKGRVPFSLTAGLDQLFGIIRLGARSLPLRRACNRSNKHVSPLPTRPRQDWRRAPSASSSACPDVHRRATPHPGATPPEAFNAHRGILILAGKR